MTARFRLPGRFAPALFGALLSGLMSLVVSGVATYKAIGLIDDFPVRWLSAWTASWAVAFPTVLVVAPIVRRMVAAMTAPSVPAPAHKHGASTQ